MAIDMYPGFSESVGRTWAQLLADHAPPEIASIAIDCGVDIQPVFLKNSLKLQAVIEVPTASYPYVTMNADIGRVMREALDRILRHRSIPFIDDQSGENFNQRFDGDLEVEFLPKLIAVEPDWQDIVRQYIANSKGVRNQGTVTSIVYQRTGKEPIKYNEMLFASQSEVRIAQEFEARKVLFFPLPLGVRNATGRKYEDHREPDFLVCADGVWGVMEIGGPGHQGRYEQDAQKGVWFKQAGILCVEYYTAERCYSEPSNVVDEFLGILARFKR